MFSFDKLGFSLSRKPFSGGIHPTGYKELSQHSSITTMPHPKQVFLGLQQRNGSMLHTIVNEGETVYKGQLVAKGASDMSVPLHSPVNGVVREIKPHVTAHPSGLKGATLVIDANDDPRWGIPHEPCNPFELSPETIIRRVLAAGVVGLGGAGFPTGIKLRLAAQNGVHTLVINGGECEPYLTCDDRLMREYAPEIVTGVELMVKAIGCKQAIIAIEDNKPAALAALTSACSEAEQVSIKSVPSLYPMGSERHLIKAVTGKAVPAGQLSTSIGVLVHNVATARAVFHAVRYQRPLIERVITVSGGAVEQPANIVVPIGALVSQVLAACGGLKMEAARLVAGGPMMGQALPSPFVPIDKSIGGLLALSEEEVRPKQSHECVRCGRCVNACPMGLMPFQMSAHSRVSDFEGAKEFGLDHCLLCGACSYVCPSNIPLVQYFQHARGALNAQRAMTNKSGQARQLTEARQLRLAKEAAEKKAAKAAKAAKSPRRKRAPRASKTTGES
ncbi:electron transport complex subunit RsxC [Corallincola holothuriorum]|uniref:Ion-translocating oxidoreductase complex subunit C n=1 Tax=Corallincola holothuriorum TaxID=2282215 RepID=A0A368NQ68_9GAMM|nr:electron transport complex subunit RsxC [Corallincola holothuriorum]RCU52548.1 electron transport complex subunit RsxC [Corallincola holothuriorum]